MNKNILITGACGVTSRSIIRSLKMSSIFNNCNFIGTDICDNMYCIYEGLYDKIYKVPNVTDIDYKKAIDTIIKKENIYAAIIIPELEVLFWSKNNMNTKYITPPKEFCEAVINKGNLYNLLKDTNYIPAYKIINRNNIYSTDFNFPLWIRDFKEGSTSGKGSFKALNYENIISWFNINKDIDEFMVSEYLPGKNYACHLLYNHGNLIKIGIYERIEYFMKKVSISGITGNICKGKLINNKNVSDIAIKAVDYICNKIQKEMHGIIAVDLCEDNNGVPKVTEINIRHVAGTSSFAQAGFNLAEYQLLCVLNMNFRIDDELEMKYNKENLILRDIDGLPIYVPEIKDLLSWKE